MAARYGARVTPNSGGRRVLIKQTVFNEDRQTYVLDSREGICDVACDVNDDKAIADALRAALRGELTDEE
ncbi:MAG: hypothetical protein EA379_10825 [Phycisphaerales bacterium]|nr:MAG: hypothetical protein EA379_10825 [Phycisphaerales bacterium]